MTDAPWLTIAAAVQASGETIKGARFVARAAPIDMHAHVDAARAVVAAARVELRDAVHHGWAYRVGPVTPDFHWSDDGEPVGSAGAAILRRIDALGLLNVVVVVSRDGGSQRLSAGDLSRGYTEAARAVLAAATPVAFVPTTPLELAFDYAVSGPVQGVLSAFRAEHVDGEYGESVRLVVRIESGRIDAFTDAIRDATAGAARVSRSVPRAG